MATYRLLQRCGVKATANGATPTSMVVSTAFVRVPITVTFPTGPGVLVTYAKRPSRLTATP